MKNELCFWGVRGSIPSPGSDTATVGGNTTCLEVRLGDRLLVLDGGSGLRAFGASLRNGPIAATLLFTHLHWDHIQGIPFFVPLYLPDSEITLVGPAGLREALARQMERPNFPVGMEAFGAALRFREITPGESFALGGVRVDTTALCHPGGALGYRLEAAGRALVFGLDHEHGDRSADARLAGLAAGADVLVYDAMYLPEEHPQRQGWGHSTWRHGVEIAARAGVRHLALTHHDPARSDDDVADLEASAQREFPGAFAAREGERQELGRPFAPADEEVGARPHLASEGAGR